MTLGGTKTIHDAVLSARVDGARQGNGLAARDACRRMALYLASGVELPPPARKWLAVALHEIGNGASADKAFGLRRQADWTKPVAGYSTQIERDRYIWSLYKDGTGWTATALAAKFNLSEKRIEQIIGADPHKK